MKKIKRKILHRGRRGHRDRREERLGTGQIAMGQSFVVEARRMWPPLSRLAPGDFGI